MPKTPLAVCALALLATVPYLPAMLWGGFVWDDNTYIQVDAVQDVSGLRQIWFSPGDLKEAHYWPLTYTTFWLEHKLWGFNPTGYHVVNVLLHLANTLLVWHLMRRLAVPGAWLVAAVFAVHPLHVESVAWVIERKDVLSGLFYLAAALTWMRFVEQPRPRRYLGALVLYVAGLLSKSIVVTLPAALLIWHWWKQGRVPGADLKRLVPFFAVGLVITVGDLAYYRSGEPLSFDYSFTERTLIASRALWFYAGKLVWPSELAVIYPRWDIGVADRGYLIAALALVMALWYFRSQLGRGPLAGVLSFAVTLSPVLGFVDHSYMLYAFVADRFQYLAGIGVMGVVIGSAAYGVGRLPGWWQRGARVVAAVVIVALGVLTWQQASIYRDDETLWRHIASVNPNGLRVQWNLSVVLRELGRHEEALVPALRAVELAPNEFDVQWNLSVVLRELGRHEEALVPALRAVEQNPYHFQGQTALAGILYKLGRHEEALVPALRARELAPNEFDVQWNLAFVLVALERYAEALQAFDRAVAIDPSHSMARQNRDALLRAIKN